MASCIPRGWIARTRGQSGAAWRGATVGKKTWVPWWFAVGLDIHGRRFETVFGNPLLRWRSSQDRAMFVQRLLRLDRISEVHVQPVLKLQLEAREVFCYRAAVLFSGVKVHGFSRGHRTHYMAREGVKRWSWRMCRVRAKRWVFLSFHRVTRERCTPVTPYRERFRPGSIAVRPTASSSEVCNFFALVRGSPSRVALPGGPPCYRRETAHNGVTDANRSFIRGVPKSVIQI